MINNLSQFNHYSFGFHPFIGFYLANINTIVHPNGVELQHHFTLINILQPDFFNLFPCSVVKLYHNIRLLLEGNLQSAFIFYWIWEHADRLFIINTFLRRVKITSP